MKFAAHRSANTFEKSYAHSLSEIDKQATYINIERRETHIKNDREMSIRRHSQL